MGNDYPSYLAMIGMSCRRVTAMPRRSVRLTCLDRRVAGDVIARQHVHV